MVENVEKIDNELTNYESEVDLNAQCQNMSKKNNK